MPAVPLPTYDFNPSEPLPIPEIATPQQTVAEGIEEQPKADMPEAL